MNWCTGRVAKWQNISGKFPKNVSKVLKHFQNFLKVSKKNWKISKIYQKCSSRLQTYVQDSYSSP